MEPYAAYGSHATGGGAVGPRPPAAPQSYGVVRLRPAANLCGRGGGEADMYDDFDDAEHGRMQRQQNAQHHHRRGQAEHNPGRRPKRDGSSPAADRRQSTSLCRWLFLYVPLILFAGLLLYAACELAMKHLAVRTMHREIRTLPADPPPLPPAAAAATGGGNHQRIFPVKAPPPPRPPPSSLVNPPSPPPPADLASSLPMTGNEMATGRRIVRAPPSIAPSGGGGSLRSFIIAPATPFT